jgi:hypothetical protein
MALTVTAVAVGDSGIPFKLKTIGQGSIYIGVLVCTFTGDEATTDLGNTIVPAVTGALTGGVLGTSPRGDVLGYTQAGSVALVDAAAGANGVVPLLDQSGAAGPGDFLYRNLVTGAVVSVEGSAPVTGWIANFIVQG